MNPKEIGDSVQILKLIENILYHDSWDIVNIEQAGVTTNTYNIQIKRNHVGAKP